MAASDSFILGLTDLADEVGSEEPIRELRATAYALIQNGQGEVGFLLNATINGKMAAQAKDMSASEIFEAASEALRIVRGTAVSVSYADFSRLIR